MAFLIESIFGIIGDILFWVACGIIEIFKLLFRGIVWLFKCIFGLNSTQSSTTESHQYILSNAYHFAELCRKIGKGGGRNYYKSVTYQFRDTATALTEVYATYTVHDNDLLEYAHNRAKENDRLCLEYAYNDMIKQYKLTTEELRSFPDVSDFMSFLQGGIPGYNSCERSGSDIKIMQKIGSIQSDEKRAILSAIEKYILNASSEYKVSVGGSTILAINFK